MFCYGTLECDGGVTRNDAYLSATFSLNQHRFHRPCLTGRPELENV